MAELQEAQKPMEIGALWGPLMGPCGVPLDLWTKGPIYHPSMNLKITVSFWGQAPPKINKFKAPLIFSNIIYFLPILSISIHIKVNDNIIVHPSILLHNILISPPSSEPNSGTQSGSLRAKGTTNYVVV